MSNRSTVLDYREGAPRLNGWVLTSFVVAVVGAALFFFVVPAMVALVLAIVVRSVAKSRGVAGMGLTNAAVQVSGWATLVGIIFGLMSTSLCACGGGKARELSNRAICAANLRGITQSMAVYAQENAGRYPIVPFGTYSLVSNEPHGISTGTTNQDAAIQAEFSGRGAQAGSGPACMWLMVLSGQVSPKQFLCKSDPTSIQTAEINDRAGNYYDNFHDGTRLSYSAAYPWNSAGEPGTWWKSSSDAGLPLIADITPKQGTGTPARNLVPSSPPRENATWNSMNHQGDGQNVGFGDGHAEFSRRPDVGQEGDNIYSMAASPSHGAARFGGIPAGAAAPRLTAEQAPFDIIMLPVRDATTGGM